MGRYRRSRFVFLRLVEERRFDLGALLRGRLEEAAGGAALLALSTLSGVERALADAELSVLRRLDDEVWSEAAEPGDEELLAGLAADGLALADTDEPRLAELRRREETLRAAAWHPWAAAYHGVRRGADDAPEPPVLDYAAIAAEGGEPFAAFVARHGPPPPAFPRREGVEEPLLLPLAEPAGELFEVLRARRTRRAFDVSRPLPLATLAALLRTVFGPYGTFEPTPGVTLVHRTSPSGGSLHPIEAYPLLTSVAGAAPGLYHYDGERHAMVPLRLVTEPEARRLAVALARGQGFVGDAHAAVLLVARVGRNLWKYRDDARTHAVMQMDAGHLGQSFALAATALDLACVFTAAVDEPRIERELGLAAFSESALAICGCGPPASGPDLGLAFAPFSPGTVRTAGSAASASSPRPASARSETASPPGQWSRRRR